MIAFVKHNYEMQALLILPSSKSDKFAEHTNMISMKALIIAFVLSVTASTLLSAQTYTVKRIKQGNINFSNNNNSAWNKANALSDFSYPWENGIAPATSFKALWNGQWLYCRYEVKDDSILVLVKKNDKLETGASDRVEIFFNINDSMRPYYCLEMDANGRLLDYSANYYRKMNYSWQWPKDQLKVKALRTSTGYIVEAAISIQSLKDLGLLQNNRLHAGLFRAECKGFINNRADLRWISWIKPSSQQPDFHIPSAFGTLILQ